MEIVEGYVWCDKLCEVHNDSLDPYGYEDEEARCGPRDHRVIYTERIEEGTYMHHTDKSIAMIEDVSDGLMRVRDNFVGEDEALAEDLLDFHDRLLVATRQIRNGDESKDEKTLKAPKQPEVADKNVKATKIKDLRQTREAKGLSRAALAEKSGVSELTIRNIEKGETNKPRQATLDKIWAALG